MGAVFAAGYVAGIHKYLYEHALLKKQVKITLVADFDPYEASYIFNNGAIKEQVFRHAGHGSITGGIANEYKNNSENYELFNSQTEGSHLLQSFVNEISRLTEGTYTWNADSELWELQSSQPKPKKKR